MRSLSLWVALVAALPSSAADPIAIDLPGAIQHARNSTVTIRARSGGRISHGSGVVVSRTGLVITARHVIDGYSSFAVSTLDGKVFAARPIAQDVDWDLALLRCETDEELLHASFSWEVDPDPLAMHFLAIGNPNGLGHTTVQSRLSPAGRVLLKWANCQNSVATIEAPIEPGYSGGGFFETKTGRLYGIIVAKSPGGIGVGYVVPMWQVLQFGLMAIADEAGNVLPEFRVPVGLWNAFGFHSTPVVLDSPKVKSGLLISHVRKNSPGDAATLRRGDILIGVDKYRAGSPADLAYVVINTKGASRTVPIYLVRDAQVINATLVVPAIETVSLKMPQDIKQYINNLDLAKLDSIDARMAAAVAAIVGDPASADPVRNRTEPVTALYRPLKFGEPEAFPTELAVP